MNNIVLAPHVEPVMLPLFQTGDKL